MDSTVISSPWGLVVKVFKIVFFLDTSEQRISRGQYWIGIAILSLGYSLFNLFGSFLGDSVFITGGIFVIELFSIVIRFILFTKRLRDLNASVLWIIPSLILYVSLLGWILSALFSGGLGGGLDFSTINNIFRGTYGLILMGIYGIVFLMAVIIGYRLCFYKSVNENNRFGPDPLRNITVTNSFYWLIAIVLVILGSVVNFFSREEPTELTLEEQQELQQYMDEYGMDVRSGSLDTGDNEGGLLGRLSNVQDRAKDITKTSDLQQISIALQTYGLDENTYPIYDSFVDVSQLSPFLVVGKNEYLQSIPVVDGSTYFYKSVDAGTGFILMVELSSKDSNANFFGLQSDIEKKSLKEIQDLIKNPVKNDGKPRYIVTN